MGQVILAPDSQGSDPRRADSAVSLVAGRSRLFSGSAAAWARAGGGVSRRESTQVSAALSYPGTIKAFHYHRHQTDCWVPVQGMFQVALVDLRKDSRTSARATRCISGKLRPWQVLIPPGVAHGYKVIGADPAMLVYVTDRFYNPKDEGRIPYNDPQIQYDWETQHK